jgi:CRP-like cAMP-binding protein
VRACVCILIVCVYTDGSPNCRFKTFDDGAVIVHQGDKGQSMFIVVEGTLAVIVTFGSGPTAQKKEVGAP